MKITLVFFLYLFLNLRTMEKILFYSAVFTVIQRVFLHIIAFLGREIPLQSET